MVKLSSAAYMKYSNAKKANGHKPNCGCVICNNINKKAQKGGYQKDINKLREGPSAKINGHDKIISFHL